MTLEEARKIVSNTKISDGIKPCNCAEHIQWQEAKKFLEGHAAGVESERNRCADILESKHYCTGLCFVCLKREEIIKGGDDGK